MHRFRLFDRYVYKMIARGIFRRCQPEDADEVPVNLPPGEIMLHLGKGIYARVHRCVQHVRCPWCGAAKGKRCVGSRGVKCGTHYHRRDAWRARQREAKCQAKKMKES